MNIQWLVSLLALTVPSSSQVECVSNGTHKVCGYHCAKSGNEAACAKTNDGICVASRGQVFCWDPSPSLRAFAKGERPECKVTLDATACGYGCMERAGKVFCADAPGGSCAATVDGIVCGFACVEAMGQRHCARTPRGVCLEVGTKVFCYDPPPEAYLVHGVELPQASCLRAKDNIACGYNCAEHLGKAQCANSPDEFCKVVDQQLRCFK